MELYYSNNITNGLCVLNEEESKHCIKVLRHTVGDIINVINGEGSMFSCTIQKCGKEVECVVNERFDNFGGHSYNLIMAVCPTKNIDRYEWFLEKATEFGINKIVPIIGDHSQRKVLKTDRLQKILISAAKQSLKGAIPTLEEPISVKDFLKSSADKESIKLIAYCGDLDKVTLNKELFNVSKSATITILIGPEGDFSDQEIRLAMEQGYKPLSLGNSRLRTETAAIAAVSSVYFLLG